MTERERTVTLRISPNETVLDARCGDCEYVLKTPEEYHPEGACVLWRAGIDPHDFVNAARRRIPDPASKVVRIRETEGGAA